MGNAFRNKLFANEAESKELDVDSDIGHLRNFGSALTDTEPAERRPFHPHAEIVQNDYCYEVSLELYGADANDISVELHDNLLMVRNAVTPRPSSFAAQDTLHHFERVFTLPDDAVKNDILANFDHGLLTVFVPRRLVQSAN